MSYNAVPRTCVAACKRLAIRAHNLVSVVGSTPPRLQQSVGYLAAAGVNGHASERRWYVLELAPDLAAIQAEMVVCVAIQYTCGL